MATANPLPDLPEIGLVFPSSSLVLSALAYSKEHTSSNTVNHSVRSAYWALIIAKKHPAFVGKPLNIEVVLLSIILHDMGWATTKSLLSEDRRFEVDGADIARNYLQKHTQGHVSEDTENTRWDKYQLQLVWDAIALHTCPSIASYKEPEVVLTHLGISSDFFGPHLPSGLITVDEYKLVADLFPRVGFKDGLIQILCGLCRDKQSTTFDNFVGEFGLLYGLDGNGTDKEKYKQVWEENRAAPRILANLDVLEEFH